MKVSSAVTSNDLNPLAKDKNPIVIVYGVLGLVFVGAVCGIISYSLKLSADSARNSESTKFVASMAATVQKTVADLHVIQAGQNSKLSVAATQTELREGVQDFALHLKALETGATIKNLAGNPVEYRPRENEGERGLILNIKKIWSPIEAELLPLTKGEPPADAVSLALQRTTTKSNELSTLVGALVNQIQETDSKSLAFGQNMRNLLTALGSVALLAMPAYFLYLGMRREKKRANRTFAELGMTDRKSTRLNSSHALTSRMPSSA